jgi:tripartite-type tricarboxylate transporter receptor subunit TctC
MTAQQAIASSGNKAAASSPEEFRALLDKESACWKKVINQLGITPQ